MANLKRTQTVFKATDNYGHGLGSLLRISRRSSANPESACESTQSPWLVWLVWLVEGFVLFVKTTPPVKHNEGGVPGRVSYTQMHSINIVE